MNKLSKKSLKSLINKISNSPTTILLFTAEWCHACKEINSIFDEKYKKLKSDIFLKKLDVDDEMLEPITLQYKIVSIPTLIILSYGETPKYITENVTKNKFDEIIKSLLEKKIFKTIETSINI